ncbi:MAG TPA: hypothetical protein VM577_04960 [Anaerovoracaceae bacterium]|nr:hypothetical protein [Anaerovoracaceae bacterium]
MSKNKISVMKWIAQQATNPKELELDYINSLTHSLFSQNKKAKAPKLHDFKGIDTSRYTVAELKEMLGSSTSKSGIRQFLQRNNIPFLAVSWKNKSPEDAPFDFKGVDTSLHTVVELMEITQTEMSKENFYHNLHKYQIPFKRVGRGGKVSSKLSEISTDETRDDEIQQAQQLMY